MDSFVGKLAVVTGGGSGMGRELGRQRILIGEDATMIDAAVGAKPGAACDYAELFSGGNT